MNTWNNKMKNEKEALLKSMKPQAMRNTSGATIPEAKGSGAYVIHSKASR